MPGEHMTKYLIIIAVVLAALIICVGLYGEPGHPESSEPPASNAENAAESKALEDWAGSPVALTICKRAGRWTESHFEKRDRAQVLVMKCGGINKESATSPGS